MEQQPMEEPTEGEKCFAWKSIHGRLWTASPLSAKFYEWNTKSSMQFFKFIFLGKRRIPSWLPYIVLRMGPSLRLFNLQTTFSIIWSFGVQLGILLLPSEKGNGTEHKSRGKNSLRYRVTKREPCVCVCVCVYEQGWKSIHKKYKACQSKCTQPKGKPKQSKQ